MPDTDKYVDVVTICDSQVAKFERIAKVEGETKPMLSVERHGDRFVYRTFSSDGLQAVAVGAITGLSCALPADLRFPCRALFNLKIATHNAIRSICKNAVIVPVSSVTVRSKW